MDNERWLPVVGFEGFYEVSDHGSVRSVTRIVKFSRGATRVAPSRVLSAATDSVGYQRVSLRRDGHGQTKKVHRLVLEAFTGGCPDGHMACHNNGDPGDNRLVNLRWDSATENMFDRVRHGRDHNVVKTHCPHGHPYSGYNLIERNGKRHCRTCGNKASREFHSKNKPDITKRTHGKPSTYTSAGCRCDECRSAFREWRLKRKAALKNRNGVLE